MMHVIRLSMFLSLFQCLFYYTSFSQNDTQAKTTHNGVKFVNDLSWDAIQKRAKKENKYIFVDVYATWCGPCKQMDKNIYPNEQVGKLLNEKFIAVKVQQDQTGKDNAYVRSWYVDAEAITKEYKIEALPSFLFFSPDGKLVHRDFGLKDVVAFIQMSEKALTDPIARFHKELEAYKLGYKDYTTIPDLIKKVRDLDKDQQLAMSMAKDYKENYLDKLSKEELCTRKHLDFIGEYFRLINSKDKFFSLCYNQPAKVDEVKDYEGWADFQVTQTINREEIDSKLWKNSKLLTTNPNWDRIYININKKYSKVDARGLILRAQISFYGRIKDYKEFVRYRDLQIKSYPPKPGIGLQSDAWGLNVHAWMMFESSNDRDILKRALAWSELSIKLDREACTLYGESPSVQLFDTKANLLYKLGRVKEAIEWEEKAIEQGIVNARKRGLKKGEFYDDYTAILDKMKKRLPTWPGGK